MPRTLTKKELEDGHVPCDCGVYTHIIKASLLKQLPEGYNGERCKECNIWMCRVDKLYPVLEPLVKKILGNRLKEGEK